MLSFKDHADDVKLLTVASVLLTIPFIFYAKDIANSLRAIAERQSGGEHGTIS